MLLPLKDENPTRRRPWVVGALIAANLGAFFYPIVARVPVEGWVIAHALVPSRLLEAGIWGNGQWVTLFSSMFLHAGLLHLSGNLLYLWIFGNNIEDVLGPVRFTLFYFLAGLAGHAAHLLVGGGSSVPTVGASGAISGVLAAYWVAFPRARVVTLLFLFFFLRLLRVPAGFVIGVWLALQVLGGMGEIGGGDGAGVAWFEHLGGFVAGLFLYRLLGGRPALRPA